MGLRVPPGEGPDGNLKESVWGALPPQPGGVADALQTEQRTVREPLCTSGESFESSLADGLLRLMQLAQLAERFVQPLWELLLPLVLGSPESEGMEECARPLQGGSRPRRLRISCGCRPRRALTIRLFCLGGLGLDCWPTWPLS